MIETENVRSTKCCNEKGPGSPSEKFSSLMRFLQETELAGESPLADGKASCDNADVVSQGVASSRQRHEALSKTRVWESCDGINQLDSHQDGVVATSSENLSHNSMQPYLSSLDRMAMNNEALGQAQAKINEKISLMQAELSDRTKEVEDLKACITRRRVSNDRTLQQLSKDWAGRFKKQSLNVEEVR